MSIFGGKEVFLFSTVQGTMTHNSQPAKNITVRRWVECDGKTYEDTTETNEEGTFEFEPLTKKEKAVLPKEFVSHQKLIAVYDGEEHLIWETVKRSEEENAELEGKRMNLACELTDEQRFVHLTLNSIGTNCTW